MCRSSIFSLPSTVRKISKTGTRCRPRSYHHPKPRLVQLERTYREIMAAAIAPSTRRIYRTARQLYTRFCQSVNFDPYPASRRTLSYFVAHLVQNGKSHRTIRVYLAGIYNYHTQHSLPLPTCQQGLRLLLRGAMYMGKQQTNRRDAITPSILRSLYTQLSGDESTSSYNKKAFWAATTLAFFACLRSDEFVSPNAKLFEPTRTLQVADISMSGTSLK